MDDARLPPLREELDLMPGPALADGQPSWTLHDPVRNLFFQIDWPSFEILARWDRGSPQEIAAHIGQATTLRLEAADVDAVLQFLRDNQLLQLAPGTEAAMAEIAQRRRGTWLQWLLHHYLFLRIPLLRPDRWLDRWGPRLDFLFRGGFAKLTLLAALLGLIGIYREWETFSSTLVDLFTWQGVLAYGATIAVVKGLHEIGHGLAAKRHGCRVPTMGIAFLVLYPVPYTDTNEAWKLREHGQRLQVAGAGIATELAIAAWATLAWVWLPEGTPRSIAFLLSTTTWISTVLVNASPFMRFDGYFLLSDWLQLPNLHARAFALARWHLRECLFALGEPEPEPFPRARRNGLIVFAWVVWLYRLTVFLGIAVLVYHFFIKAAGIFLFMIELLWFILMPLRAELRAWAQRWPQIRASRRARWSAALALAAVALFLVPWPARIATSARLEPVNQFAVYAPAHASVAELPVADGQAVAAGAPLLRLASPDVDTQARRADARQTQLAWQSAAAGFDPRARKDWQVLNEQLASARAEQAATAADARRYRPLAPYAGRLEDVDPDLAPGQWLSEREPLGLLVGDGPWQVVTYVDEDDVRRIAPGDSALFLADGLAGPDLRVTVAAIDKDASRVLGEPELAAPAGGHVLMRERNGQLYPERAVYRVVLKVDTPPAGIEAQHNWRGRLSIAGRWEAPGQRFVRSAMTVLWREAGF